MLFLLADVDGLQFRVTWGDVTAIAAAFLTATGLLVRAIWTTKGALAEESKQAALLRQSVEAMARKLDEALADKRNEYRALWERVTELSRDQGQLSERVRVLEVRVESP